MKKQIVMLLCTAVLTLGLTAAPAMASAESFSPIEVEVYAGASGATGFQPFDTDFTEKGAVSDLLPFWVCAGCMAMAAAIKLCAIKSEKGGESE